MCVVWCCDRKVVFKYFAEKLFRLTVRVEVFNDFQVLIPSGPVLDIKSLVSLTQMSGALLHTELLLWDG